MKKSADAGLDIAQAELGHLYNDGSDGVTQDFKKALHYYQLAVKQDEPTAINNLGIYYLEGKGEIKTEL